MAFQVSTCLPARNHAWDESAPLAPVVNGVGAFRQPLRWPAGERWQKTHSVIEGRYSVADLYTCSCGNQTWEIFDTGVRCLKCKTEFATPHTPVAEFNHAVTEELEEALEE